VVEHFVRRKLLLEMLDNGAQPDVLPWYPDR